MNENMEVGITEHDPPPQASLFPHERIREDISESDDEPKEEPVDDALTYEEYCLAAVCTDFDDNVPSHFNEFVTVTAKVANENDEFIAKHEAICRTCDEYVLEEINPVKTKCKCKLTLLHEKCALEWSEKEENKSCGTCEELIHCIPVTLTITSRGESHERPCFGKCLPKKFSRLFGSKSG